MPIMCIFAGVLSAFQIPWLPCKFIDERVSLKDETVKIGQHTVKGLVHTERIPRQATLQFGQKGDAPVHPDNVTFLITRESFCSFLICPLHCSKYEHNGTTTSSQRKPF